MSDNKISRRGLLGSTAGGAAFAGALLAGGGEGLLPRRAAAANGAYHEIHPANSTNITASGRAVRPAKSASWACRRCVS